MTFQVVVNSFFKLISIVALFFVCFATADQASFRFEHDVNGNWKSRGSLNIQYSPSQLGHTKLVPTFQSRPFSELSKDFQSLSSSSANNFYRVRICGDSGKCFQSSARRCDLAKSGMSEQLVLHSNDAGDIIDIDLLPTQSCDENEKYSFSDVKLEKWDPSIKVADSKQITRTQDQQNKIPTDDTKPKQKQEQPEEEKSFFQKYGHIILPVVVLVLMNAFMGGGGSGDDQAQGQQGGQPGAQQGAAAATRRRPAAQ